MVKKVDGSTTNIELYYRDINNSNARVQFSDGGSGALSITSGSNSIIHAESGSRNRFLGNRVAGSPESASYLYAVDGSQYTNNQHWGLNYNEQSNVPALKVVGCEKSIFSSNVMGEYPESGDNDDNIDFSILIEDWDNNSQVKRSKLNIIADNVYQETASESTTRFVKDDSAAVYTDRNIISGLGNLDTLSRTKRIESSTYYSEPDRFYLSAELSTSQVVADATNTDLTWQASGNIGNPAGLTVGTTTTLTNTKESVIDINGQIGFSSRPAGDFYVLVFVKITDPIGPDPTKNHRFYEEFYTSTNSPSITTIPFKIRRTIESSDAQVTVQVYQNSGSSMTINNGTDYTWMTVSKVADYLP